MRNLTVIVLAALVVFVAATPGNVTLKDDAYHFSPSPHHDLFYTEWWYFNFVCDSGFSGIYVYGVWDPEDKLDVGQSIMYALQYEDTGKVIPTEELASYKEMVASYDEADVTVMNVNTIKVIDESTYSVVGKSSDGDVSWKLSYSAQVEPWFFYQNASMGKDWEELSWLVYMPRALVNGEVAINGVQHAVDNCRGYHDHDWGRWFSFSVTWAWAQQSSENITLVMGLGRLSEEYSPANNAWVKIHALQDLTIKFSSEDCQVEYSDFVDSDIPLHKYPAKGHFLASNNEYTMDVHWNVLLSPGIWKSAVVVFEQRSLFMGVIRDQQGDVVHQWEGIGFSEWTDKLI